MIASNKERKSDKREIPFKLEEVKNDPEQPKYS